MNPTKDHETVVVGAGPGGLAISHALKQMNLENVVLEKGALGETWNNLYDSLTLHTGKHLSSLPGLPFNPEIPLFPTREHFLSYLFDYKDHFDLPIISNCEVKSVTKVLKGWELKTNSGLVTSKYLVVATGIYTKPNIPQFIGDQSFEGDIIHSSHYRNSKAYLGKKVLIVGVGNSGAEIASELAGAGVLVSISIRSGAHVVPLLLCGLPIQYHSVFMQKLPNFVRKNIGTTFMKINRLKQKRSLIPKPDFGLFDRPPVVGLKILDLIGDEKIKIKSNIKEFLANEVVFDDESKELFDKVILATGYRPALDLLGPLIKTDERGFAQRKNRVTSSDQEGLFFMGQNYAAVGALLNMRKDCKLIANGIQRLRTN